MGDDRRVEELSLAELEALVEERRRLERARQFASNEQGRRFRPVTVEPVVPESKRRRGPRIRSWRDRILLAIEVAAAVALLAIIVNSLGLLQTLNQEVAQAQRSAKLPAPARTASAPGVELPGSSYAPGTGNGGELPGSSAPPEGLPDALGVSVSSAPSLPPPTPGPQSPTRIVIPALNIDWPIVPGDGWEELKRGVGHHIGSANPGERGNMVLTGHDDVFGEVFRDLGNLKNGDEVIVYAGGHSFRYVVRAQRVVAPTEISVLGPTREAVVTLITCTPYRVDTERLIVIAQLAP